MFLNVLKHTNVDQQTSKNNKHRKKINQRTCKKNIDFCEFAECMHALQSFVKKTVNYSSKY